MRTTFKNRSEICHIWAQQSQKTGKAGNIFFEGKSIFSYGYHFEIARFITDDIVFLTTRGYSVSTSSHKSEVRQAIRHKKIFTVVSFNDHSGNIDYYLSEIAKTIQQSKTARTNKYYLIRDSIGQILNLTDYIKTFSVKLYDEQKAQYKKFLEYQKSIDLTEINRLIEEQQIAISTKRTQESLIREAKRESELKEDIEKWINNKLLTLPYLQYARLRVNGPMIETSNRAYVELSAAKLLYLALKAGKSVIGHKISEYTVISHNDEEIKIGCHTIKMAEVERIAKLLNWNN